MFLPQKRLCESRSALKLATDFLLVSLYLYNYHDHEVCKTMGDKTIQDNDNIQ